MLRSVLYLCIVFASVPLNSCCTFQQKPPTIANLKEAIATMQQKFSQSFSQKNCIELLSSEFSEWFTYLKIVEQHIITKENLDYSQVRDIWVTVIVIVKELKKNIINAHRIYTSNASAEHKLVMIETLLSTASPLLQQLSELKTQLMARNSYNTPSTQKNAFSSIRVYDLIFHIIQSLEIAYTKTHKDWSTIKTELQDLQTKKPLIAPSVVSTHTS